MSNLDGVKEFLLKNNMSLNNQYYAKSILMKAELIIAEKNCNLQENEALVDEAIKLYSNLLGESSYYTLYAIRVKGEILVL